MKKYILPVLILNGFFFTSFLWAGISAVIVDLDGEVLVSRNGTFLDDVDFGTVLYSHDILHTGSGGYAELDVKSSISPSLAVKISENTTMFLEHSLGKQNPGASLNVFRGAVKTRAAKLVSGSSFTIKTNSTVMGIRGTSFTVNTFPDSSLLVSCEEGEVVCSTGGEEVFIMPGKIYETNSTGQYRVNRLPPEEIDAYTEEWKTLRLEALMVNGVLSLEHYANLYLQIAPGFLESFNELESKQGIIKKWEGILAEEKTMSMADATHDKILLSNGIILLRSRLPVMEHVFYTLYDLTAYMEKFEERQGELSDSALRTLRIYEKRQMEFMEKLTLARYYFKIYLEIDKQASGQGFMPTSDLMNDFLLDDSFFSPPAPGQRRHF